MCYFKVLKRAYARVDWNVYVDGEIGYEPVLDGGRVLDMSHLRFYVKEGFMPIMYCIKGFYMFNQEVKELLESMTDFDEDVEYLPLQVDDTKGNVKTYYGLHFKRIMDALDKELTVYNEFSPGSVIKPYIDNSKVVGKEMFTISDLGEWFVSKKIKNALIRKKLSAGMAFWQRSE